MWILYLQKVDGNTFVPAVKAQTDRELKDLVRQELVNWYNDDGQRKQFRKGSLLENYLAPGWNNDIHYRYMDEEEMAMFKVTKLQALLEQVPSIYTATEGK